MSTTTINTAAEAETTHKAIGLPPAGRAQAEAVLAVEPETCTEAKAFLRLSAEDRRAAEAPLQAVEDGTLRPPLRNAIDAVEAAGVVFRQAERAEETANAELVRLCGSPQERAEIEDRGRASVPIPEALRGIREPGRYIARMLVVYDNGEVMRDLTMTQAPLIDWSSSYQIEGALNDPAIRAKINLPLKQWLLAKSDAWDSLYDDDQRAAYATFHAAQKDRRQAEKHLTSAVGKLMRVRANTLREISAKVHAWAEAWGILKDGGKVATGQMDEWDNQFVLGTIAEDLLRGHPQGRLAKASGNATPLLAAE